MNRKPRIGLFVIRFPKLSETFIVTKLVKMLDAGFDVHVFCFAESNDWDKFELLRGRDDIRDRVHVLPPARPWSAVLTEGAWTVANTAAKHPASFLRYVRHNWSTRDESPVGFLKSLYQRIIFVGHELDVLHIEFDAQGIGIADLKEYFGCRILLSGRGTFQHMLIGEDRRRACDYLFRYVDGYHFISDYLEGRMRALGLPASVPTWHVEPAIDLGLFDPGIRGTRGQGDVLKVISVGRLAWAKGYEHALDAIARAREEGVQVDYTIYGEGDYAQPIEFAIRQLGLMDCARIAGALPREAMPAVYANADVMLHAALEEGFCNAVIEAQAMELPVVTSDAGGLPENVEDQVTGFVVPKRDAAAMAGRLVALARNPELRRTMGRAGRVRAIARFDLDRQAEAFVKLYSQLLGLPAVSGSR